MTDLPARLLARSPFAGRLGIGWLFALALAPGILAGSFLVYSDYRSNREQLEQSALQTARALSVGLERELAGINGKLEILATLPSIQAGDLRAFHAQAKDVLRDEALGEAIVLIDRSGRQVVNTLRPYGADLPQTGHPELVRKTFETGRPQRSDFYIGGVAKRPFVALEVPVLRDGSVVYALDMGISGERLNRLLLEQNLPPGWIASVLDSRGIVVARNHNPESAVGHSATPDLVAAIERVDEGRLASHTLEGAPSFLAFSRSPASRWTVVVAMTRDVLYANRRVALVLASVTVAAFMFGGAILAWIFSRRVRDALAALEIVTQAASHGDLSAMATLRGPREIARLADRFNRMQQARKETEAQLRLAASVFSAASEGIIIAGPDARIIEVNAAFTELTGYGRNEVIGRDPRLLKSGRHGREFFEDMWRALAVRGHWQGELWNRRKDGTPFAVHMTLSVVRDAAGEISHYIALFSDITLAQQQQEAIERLAYYDPLTRLPNRRLLLDRMEQALTRAERQRSFVAVCYLDLDGFKPVNDAFGHKAGDQVLVETAHRLEQAVRTHDTVTRLGGDEFVLLLTDLKRDGEAGPILERVLQAISEPFDVGDRRVVTISASIGVAFFPVDGDEPDTLLRLADQAMYEAKRAGKHRIQRSAPRVLRGRAVDEDGHHA